jgi:hypothetical protein
MNNERLVYQSVKSFRDLIDINIKFLKGEIKQTYYHLGPVDPETVPLLAKLVEINNYGFYSTNGQPGLFNIHYVIPEYNDLGELNPNYEPNKFADIRQKSYITGLMITSEADKLKEFIIKNYPEYNIIVQDFDNFYSTISLDIMDYPLTDERDYSEGEWEHYTNLPNTHEPNSLVQLEIFKDRIPEYNNLSDVTISAKEWGPDYSVEDVLLDFYNTKIKYTLNFIFKYFPSDLDAFIAQYTNEKYENIADKRYMTMYYLYENNFLDKETENLLGGNSDKFQKALQVSNTAQELRNNML